MEIVQFNFNDYFENPIVQFCQKNNRQNLHGDFITLTLEDCLPAINNCRHSKWCLDNEIGLSHVTDQLRMYYSLQYDDYMYLDADVYIKDFDTIIKNKNCISYENAGKKMLINNGTFFHTDKDCGFNRFYFDIYQNEEKTNMMINYKVTEKWKYTGTDIKPVVVKNKHFALSTFQSFKKGHPNVKEIFYNRNKDFSDLKDTFWQMVSVPAYIVATANTKQTVYFYDTEDCIEQDTLIELWKEQLNYEYKTKLKFTEL